MLDLTPNERAHQLVREWLKADDTESARLVYLLAVTAIRDAEAAEREKCCRDVYRFCFLGHPLTHREIGYPSWLHEYGHEWTECKASRIRARAAKEGK